jgi:DNA-binding IclR family transcriptional regulator
LPPITDKTITNFSELKTHLTEVRVRGYAVDDQETYPGIRCVAAPIRNHRGAVLASLSISGPIQRVTEANVTVFGDVVMNAAAKISARLGYVATVHTNQPVFDSAVTPAL